MSGIEIASKRAPLEGRVGIILPPGGQFAYPTLAPASLKGYLGAGGLTVDVFDLNISAFYDIASAEGIERLFVRLAKQAPTLVDSHANHADATHLIELFLSMNEAERGALHGICDRLRDIETFRHETAYSVTLHHLGLLKSLVELTYHPLKFEPGSIIGGMFSRCSDVDSMLAVDAPYDDSVQRHLDATDWAPYQVIGFSAFSVDQLIYALRIARDWRQPRPVFVLGGNCLTESEIPPSLMTRLVETFDVVVEGDGELPLLRTVEYALDLGTIEEIPNASFLRNGHVHKNPEPYKYRFEREVAPDFSGLPMDRYLLPRPVLPFRFSNGCDYGKCTFCSESADRGPMSSWIIYREVPTAHVAQHLSELSEHWNASLFVNCSSLLTATGAAEIGDAIAERGLDIQWFAMVRAESAWTSDRISRAVAGGASTLNFGIESFNQRVNRLMKKGINVRHAPKLMAEARSHGVVVSVYTMANFPTETIAEYSEHLEVVDESFDGAVDTFFKSNFMLVPDAPVYEQLSELGIDIEPAQLEQMRAETKPIYLLPDQKTGSHSFRQPGDGLEEKLDRYHSLWLRRVMKEPLYLDRDLEIVSRTFYWEPEYNMIIKEQGGKQFLPGYSLGDLMRGTVRLASDACFESLSNGVVAITVRHRGVALYYGGCTGRLLEQLHAGRSFFEAFRWVVDHLNPSARELLELYVNVHRELRQCGALVVECAPSPDPPVVDHVGLAALCG